MAGFDALDSAYRFEPDFRVKTLSMTSPLMPVTLISAYLYVVYVSGPNFMKDRKPLKLKWITRIYNVLQVAANLFFGMRIAYLSYVTMGYSLVCVPPDKHTDETSMELLRLAVGCWWLRVADFLDTLFFVLRKKQSQVTFLHVFHHVIVVAGGWVSTKFGLLNLLILPLCINSVVHVLMYSYYFLATLGPHVQKHLWWKRHLTKLQIGQFCIQLVHVAVPLFKECGYPKEILFFWFLAITGIMALFINFYVRSYSSLKSRKGM